MHGCGVGDVVVGLYHLKDEEKNFAVRGVPKFLRVGFSLFADQLRCKEMTGIGYSFFLTRSKQLNWIGELWLLSYKVD